MKNVVGIIILTCLSFLAAGQSESHRKQILSETNSNALQEIIDKQETLQTLAAAKRSEFPKEITIRGKKAFLANIDQQGNPRYVTPDNLDAAISIRVNELWSGGDSGYDLDGSGVVVGVWEAGGVTLEDHNEMIGKIEIIDDMASITYHATHVTGTIISEGNNPNAIGMAPGAVVKSSDSNNDISELAAYAMDGGLLTNHSYGTILFQGNVHRLGMYTSAAAQWDELLFNSPYLLSCKSAGNTRGDGYNILDNGYDQLLNASCAKNNLVVGAIGDVDGLSSPTDFVESSFSSWGPTDDWRIKPDITANGVGVFSCSNQGVNAYDFSSGTSMSVATVTGAIALLQEYYESLNGMYMKSATAKALILGTADELGPHEGPDFREGWGLMNARKAADAIFNNGSESIIRETTLDNQTTETISIQVGDDSEVAIMIAWTDPQSSNVGQGENLSPSLVNDLDVRLIGPDGTLLPWMMDPQLFGIEFGNAAVKGDNIRDNVERINATIVQGGVYDIVITHKGELENGNQDFSLVVTGIQGETTNVTDVLAERIQVYPNPIDNGVLNIDLNALSDIGTYSLSLTDLNGKLVMDDKVISSNTLSVDVSSFLNGVYVLRLKTDRGTLTKRIVIQ